MKDCQFKMAVAADEACMFGMECQVGCQRFSLDPQPTLDKLFELSRMVVATSGKNPLQARTDIALISSVMTAVIRGNKRWWGSSPPPTRPLSVEGRVYALYNNWRLAST